MPSQHSVETIKDFAVHTLSNDQLSLSLVPELGGRIVSLQHRGDQREWLDGWQPESERRLWRPSDAAVFETSPGAGIDECLPTVLPCSLGDLHLPDHGEIWSRAAHLDEEALSSGELSCSWQLHSLPLAFTRTASLTGTSVRLRYCLTNLAKEPTPFLWAWHPLFTIQEGDTLHIDPEVTHCYAAENEVLPWPEARPGQDLARADLGTAEPAAAKVFLGPLAEGRAVIQGRSSRLSLSWPAAQFPWVGVWITRGAWKGLHHWAVEPTNEPVDHLSDLSPQHPLTLLAPSESREWEIEISLEVR